MQTILRLRRGTAAEWIASNRILASAEPGVETDTGQIKVGNGRTPWVDLPYVPSEAKLTELVNEIVADLVFEGVPGPAGPTGPTGATGATGPIGLTGPAGSTGLTGSAGSPGATGATGPTGADGVDGTNGVDGVDGADGLAGESVTVTLVPNASWPPASDSNPLHLYVRLP